MQESIKYIGLDVFKETISVSVARGWRDKVCYQGEIPNAPEAMAELLLQPVSLGCLRHWQ